MSEPTGELVRLAEAGGVATITLDSPADRNALSARLRGQLSAALTAVSGRQSVRVVVLSHSGPVFCSGMDLAETAGAAEGAEPIRELPALLRLVARCPHPVIARVAGPARAAGIGLLASADIVIALSRATFAFSEVRLGLVPAVISVPVLRRVSPAAARPFFLTGDTFDGRQAARLGLIDDVAETEAELDTAVADRVRSLLRGGPAALTATKTLLAQGFDDSDARFSALLDLSARHFSSAEGREGGRAFVAKRPPGWVTE